MQHGVLLPHRESILLSALSGSLLDQIGESFSHPKDIPSRLASVVSAQEDFFMTYILTNRLARFSLEILQPGLLLLETLRSYVWDRGKKKHPYVYSLPYYSIIPFVSLCMLIGTVYAVVSPFLLTLLVSYFLLGYSMFINQDEKKNDDLNKEDRLIEYNIQKALDAYSPHCLQPMDLGLVGTSSMMPFISPSSQVAP